MQKKIFFTILPLLLISCGQASAQIDIPNPLQASNFTELIDGIISFIFMVGIALAPVMFIVAGFYFITAGGDPKRVQTAKQIMLYTSIGLVIILLAKALVYVLKNIIGVN